MKKYIFGNWKMYLDYKESVSLAKKIARLKFDNRKFEFGVFPNNLAFTSVAKEIKKSKIKLGAQDVAWIPKGAYTGATSALLFKEVGADYALVGHSERRYIFGDTEEIVRKKMESNFNVGLKTVLCVGETMQDRKDDKRAFSLKKQLKTALENLDIVKNGLIIAYEPVWAIGTGEACLPVDAEDVAVWIKIELKKYTDEYIPVLYGGSVNPDNIATYLDFEAIDGVLVGGASSKFEELKSLIKKL